MATDRPADPAAWPATELLQAYRSGALSPVEAAQAALARIKRLNPPLNAFTLVDEEGALAAARASEARWRHKTPAGALDGVPVTIKDLLLTKGWPTLRGSKLTSREQSWEDDAPAALALKAQAPVILGKTTTPEFGWKAIGDSPLTGITRNPWNPNHTPGGSSAGAAVAASACMGALHVGTDGAGSIRIPASFTGIVGLKPSLGRVPAWPPSPFAIVSHTGPMTRTVADCALMLACMVRPDPRDPYALPPAARDYTAGLVDGVKGLRIAFSPTLGYAAVDPEIAGIVASAISVFARLGAIVEQADPGFANPRDAFAVLWDSGAAKLLAAFSAEQRKLVDPGLEAIARDGARYSAVDYLAAEAERAALLTRMNLFHQRWDLLVTPMMPVPPLPVAQDMRPGDRHWIDWSPFSYPFNMTRQPAISVPCGVDSRGLPVGLQIVGPSFADHLVLRAAAAFERARPFPSAPVA
ncbi:MAG: amidase [Alphaproteobacteria bacterium]|nr:amidase [Alphaproteobacteria bacterium]